MRYYIVIKLLNPITFHLIHPIPPTFFLLLVTSTLKSLPLLSSSFIIILSLLTPLYYLTFCVYIAFILFHLLYYQIPLYYFYSYNIASLVNIAPSSYIVGGLSSASAEDNSKGSGSYNAAKGGPTSY
jgi:hypothetical protein